MKDFFKPEDFFLGFTIPDVIAARSNEILNAEVEKWPVVYTDKTQSHLSFVDEIGFTHKARLAFIEEIKKEPCKHIIYITNNDLKNTEGFCKICKIELVAIWSEKK